MAGSRVQPRLSIVILSWNTRALLTACLRSLERVCDRVQREILVVDNASSDGSPDCVERDFPAVRLLRNERNEGYARGNNLGIRAARGELLLLLNSDTEMIDGSLDRMVAFLDEHPGHGAVGGGLRNADNSIQRACMRFPSLLVPLFFDMDLDRRWPENPVMAGYFMRDYDHCTSRDVDQPPGACLLLRRAVLDQVGLFDEDLFLYFNDVDLCLRIWRAGWRIHYLVEAPVIHHLGRSTAKYDRRVIEWQRNRLFFYRKHFGLLGGMLVRLMVRWRAREERVKIRARLEEPAERRAAEAELDTIVAAVLRGRGGAAKGGA